MYKQAAASDATIGGSYSPRQCRHVIRLFLGYGDIARYREVPGPVEKRAALGRPFRLFSVQCSWSIKPMLSYDSQIDLRTQR
jgi:hypothetical protein